MNTTPKIYMNGKFFDKADAKISVFDHGLLYGDGIFEGLRIYESRVFRLRRHLDRLYDSAKALKLEIPLSFEQMMDAVRSTVEVNQKKNGYIRLIVTRGVGTLGLDPRKASNPQVIIIVDDISMYPQENYDNGLAIVTASTIRNHPNSLNPRIKSLNYLSSILAQIESIEAGCVEALMLNHKGEVAECSADNIFLVKKGVLKTPPPEAGILEGITREAVMELARKASITVQETALTRFDVYGADECFLSGTGAEIISVIKVDGRSIGTGKPGPITKQLRERFHQLVRSPESDR
ncbi:MAG TPA: branched-chain-amino-acid transaminase [Gemmataceae bacterium]|jgi:branched-chain amino acid aminotransferase|nr:branched-chain-amino-acid transaminase [Gemmataceae bacterium]